MSTYEQTCDAIKRVTGRALVLDIRPEFNSEFHKNITFDPGSLDAPEIMPAGSCRAPTYDTSLKFYATGVSR